MENKLQSSVKKRYMEIDIIKFAAIIFMIFVHTYEIFTYEAFFESPDYEKPVVYAFNYLIEFLGGVPAAPVFMFCLGLGNIFSRDNSPLKQTKRAFMLLLLGLLVNLFEQVFPLIWENPSLEDLIDAIPWLFSNDVYFFFTLACLFFAFAYATKKPVLVCGITCVLSLVGGFFFPFMDFTSDNAVRNTLLGLFFYTNELSFFPFTSWIVFPAAGYLFGAVLTKTEDRKKLYTRCAIIGIIGLVLITVIGLSLGYENSMLNALECADEDFYTPNFFSQTWALAFIMLFIPVCYWISTKIKPGKLTNLFTWGSRRVKELYVLQWLVIVPFTPILMLSSNIAFTYAMAAVITVLTFLLVALYMFVKSKLTKKQPV